VIENAFWKRFYIVVVTIAQKFSIVNGMLNEGIRANDPQTFCHTGGCPRNSFNLSLLAACIQH